VLLLLLLLHSEPAALRSTLPDAPHGRLAGGTPGSPPGPHLATPTANPAAVVPPDMMQAASLPPPLPLPPPPSAPVAVPRRPATWAAGPSWALAPAGPGGGDGEADTHPAGPPSATSSVDGAAGGWGDAPAAARADAGGASDKRRRAAAGGGAADGGAGGADGMPSAVPFVTGESPVTPGGQWVEAARCHAKRSGRGALLLLPPPALPPPAAAEAVEATAAPTAARPPRRRDTRRARGEFTRRLLLSSMGW